MDKKEAIKKLKEQQENAGCEGAHIEADDILLELIDDEDVEEAWHKVCKWYA